MQTIVIDNVSQAKYSFLFNKLRQEKGVLITGNTIEFHGVQLGIAYAGTTLTLTVLKKPFMLPVFVIKPIIEEQMEGFVEPKPVVVPAKAVAPVVKPVVPVAVKKA